MPSKQPSEPRITGATIGACAGIMPTDVWLDRDQGAYFVLFSLAPTGAGHEEMLGFAIDAITLAVSRVAPISVHLTQDAWVAQNIGTGR